MKNGRMTTGLGVFLLFAAGAALIGWTPADSSQAGAVAGKPFQPTWESLRKNPTPQWLREGKFGIYTHWGVYSVPAVGPNGTWYSNHMSYSPKTGQGV